MESRIRTTVRARSIVLAAVLGALLTLVGAPVVASAADNGDWAVLPTPPDDPGSSRRTAFYLDARPEQVLEDSVRVFNQTERTLEFELHAADAYNTPRDGSFALKEVVDEQVDVGSWIDLEVTSISVPPESAVDVPFTITVPENASPGDHTGGIVALDPQISRVAGEGGSFGVRRAVGVRLYLRVEGPTIPGLRVSDVAVTAPRSATPTEGTDVAFTIANTGNLQLNPDVELRATGLFGRQLATPTPLPALDLVPGAETILSTDVGGYWPLDLVTLEVVADAGSGTSSVARGRALAVAWVPLASSVLFLVAAVYAALRWRRHRRVRAERALAARPRLHEVVG